MCCICAEPKDPSNTLRAQQIKTAFFTPEILSAICQGLVGHYFLLTSEDLQMWEDDPETYGNFLRLNSNFFFLSLFDPAVIFKKTYFKLISSLYVCSHRRNWRVLEVFFEGKLFYTLCTVNIACNEKLT